MKKTLTSLIVLVCGAAHGAGFATDTHGARATGMATAVAAHIDDASAAFYNPAGLSQGKGLKLQLGDTLILPSVTYTNASGTATAAKTVPVPPPHLYAGFGITDDLSVGLGLFSSFGASSNWPEDWEGRFRTTRASLATYFINPEAAYRVTDRLKVGAGVQIVRGTVVLQRGLNFVDSEGGITLGGGAWGIGVNAGAQVEVVPKVFSVGATYRSAVSLPFTGGAHFRDVPPELSGNLKDQGVRTDLILPQSASLGLAWRPPGPFEALQLGFDAVYVAWGSFKDLAIHFDDPAISSRQPKNWNDTWNWHLGGEYAINDQIKARAGVVYDPTVSPADTLTPDLPDTTRIKIALGAGYKLDAFDFDLGYQLVLLTAATSTAPGFPGTYSGTAHVVGLTVGYRM